MVGVTLMPLVALSIFLAQVAAQSGCSVSVLNVNGAEKGSACIEPGQPGDIPVDNPPHGRIDISVSATAQCGLGNPTHNLPPDWTLRSNGRCELPRPDLPRPNPPRPNPPHPSPSPHKGGSGGGGGGVPIIPPPPPPGKVVPPPGGGGSGSQPKPKPKKRCSREYCHGPQGCCTQPGISGSCEDRKECNNYPCDTCCGIPSEHWTYCSMKTPGGGTWQGPMDEPFDFP